MSTITPLPGIHDPDLISRDPINQPAWRDAWLHAIGGNPDAGRDPELRDPRAQVGICHFGARTDDPDRGCRSALVPTGPPEVRGTVVFFEAICTGCHRSYGATAATPRNRTADAAVDGWQPGT